MKKVFYIILPALLLLSCGNNTQKVETTPTESHDLLNLDQVCRMWPSKTFKSADGDILSLVEAFNQAMPTYSVTTFLRDAKLPEDQQEYIDFIDLDNGYVGFSEGSDDKESESMQARVWKRDNGHQLLAVSLSQPSSAEVAFVAFYDYDPATQTLSPEYDYLKYFKISFANSMFSISLPQEGDDIVVSEYFMNWWTSIKHTYVWDGNAPSQCVTTLEELESMEALYNEVADSGLDHPFTQYDLLDIDEDGEPELILSDDQEENQGVFSIVQGKTTLLAASDFKRHLMFFKGVVGDAGSCGTGCYYSKYSVLQNSSLLSTLAEMKLFNMETEEMDSEFELDENPITEEEGLQKLESFGEPVEPVFDWRPLNP